MKSCSPIVRTCAEFRPRQIGQPCTRHAASCWTRSYRVSRERNEQEQWLVFGKDRYAGEQWTTCDWWSVGGRGRSRRRLSGRPVKSVASIAQMIPMCQYLEATFFMFNAFSTRQPPSTSRCDTGSHDTVGHRTIAVRTHISVSILQSAPGSLCAVSRTAVRSFL